MSTKRKSVRALVIGGLFAVGVIGASIGVAGADASHKKPTYDAWGKSSAGLGVEGVVVIGHTESDSETDDDNPKSESDANSSASANSLQVLGKGVGSSATCESEGDNDAGVQRTEDHGGPGPGGEPVVLGADPVTITVLSASCESRAVKSNNASSSAETSVLRADIAGIEVVVLGTKSSTKTTSGQAGSGQTEGSVTVASVDGTTVLGCSTRSQSTNGGETGGSSVTVAGNEQAVEDCPFASADTSYNEPEPSE